MKFNLEAVFAKKGDALILHCGTDDDPRWMLIDGGTGVWTKFLRPRLREIRDDNGFEKMPLDLVMVSHIDDDHINGVLNLIKILAQDDDPEFEVKTLWHNAFDRLLGTTTEELVGALADDTDEGIVASVKQGVDLTNFAEQAKAKGRLTINGFFESDSEFPALIISNDANTKPFEFGKSGVKFTVLAPNIRRLKDFQEEWDKELKRRKLVIEEDPEGAGASVGAIDPNDAFTFQDNSKYNLASIVVLAEREERQILLTGDATGEDIVEGLVRAGHLPEEALLDQAGLDADRAAAEGETPPDGPVRKVHRFHVDLLKVPHHGSPNNVTTGMFRRVTADEYVISGDGDHGNPNVHMLDMLREARADDGDPYTIHFTLSRKQISDFEKENKEAIRVGRKRLDEWLKHFEADGHTNPTLVFRDDEAFSLNVDLGTAE